MKKLLSLAMALVMAVSLVGCEKSGYDTLYEMDQALISRMTPTNESFTMMLDLDDPQALVEHTVYESENGTISLYSVNNISPSGCDLTFLCQGVLAEDHAVLISGAVPDPAQELVTMRKAQVSASPAELFSLEFDAITPEFGRKGNSFRLHLNIKDPKAAAAAGNGCAVTVSGLLLTTWEGEKPVQK